ncbi:MAG: hypothetical protein ACQEQG_06805 [Bacillota bacterium]
MGEAGNDREAIQAYEEHQPDLVIMDITILEFDRLLSAAKVEKISNINV